MASNRRVTGQALVQTGYRLVSTALGATATAFVARALGREDFGWFVTSLSIAGVFSFASDLGISQIATREMVEGHGRLVVTARAAIRGRFMLAAPMTLIAIIFILPQPGRLAVAGVLVVATIPVGCLNSYQTIFYARQRPLPIGYASLLQSALWTSAAGYGLAAHRGPIFFGLSFLVAAFCQGICLMVCAEWEGRHSDRSVVEKQVSGIGLVRRSALLGIAAVLWSLMQRAPLLLATALAGPSAAALLGAAIRFLDAGYLLPTTAGALLLPMYVQRREERDRLTRLAATSAALACGFGLVLVSNLYLAAPWLSARLFGAEFDGLAAVLVLALAVVVPFSLDCIWGTALIAFNRGGELASSAAVALAVSTTAACVLVPYMGAVGGACALLLGQTVRAALLGRRAAPIVGAAPLRMWLAAAAAAVASALVLVAATLAFGPPQGLPATAAECVGASIIVVGIIRTLGLVTREDLRPFFSQNLRP